MKKLLALTLMFTLLAVFVPADEIISASAADGSVTIKQARTPLDTFIIPLPQENAVGVPLRTSFYFQLYVDGDDMDRVDVNSIEVQLLPEGGEPVHALKKTRIFRTAIMEA